MSPSKNRQRVTYVKTGKNSVTNTRVDVVIDCRVFSNYDFKFSKIRWTWIKPRLPTMKNRSKISENNSLSSF
ncbi:hypothetical protein QTP88_009337 [Uroleucon formosanum]